MNAPTQIKKSILLFVVFALLLSACASAAPEPETIIETIVVERPAGAAEEMVVEVVELESQTEAGPEPRHPSQLYEAVFEGLILFLALYYLHRRKVPEGCVFFSFFLGYGLIRFVIEFFRQPDAHLGFLWGGATMGQVLSLPMVLIGLVGLGYCYFREARRA